MSVPLPKVQVVVSDVLPSSPVLCLASRMTIRYKCRIASAPEPRRFHPCLFFPKSNHPLSTGALDETHANIAAQSKISRASRTTQSELMMCRTHRASSSIQLRILSGVADGRKEMSRGSENPMKRNEVGGTGEKKIGHAAWLLALRLRSFYAYARTSLRLRPGIFMVFFSASLLSLQCRIYDDPPHSPHPFFSLATSLNNIYFNNLVEELS